MLWGGGIDIQTLPFMTLEEVEKSVEYSLDIMAPGGGCVFAATHNILPETPGDKIHAAYLAAVQSRDYDGITHRLEKDQ